MPALRLTDFPYRMHAHADIAAGYEQHDPRIEGHHSVKAHSLTNPEHQTKSKTIIKSI